MKRVFLAGVFVIFGTILNGCAGGYGYSYGYAYGPPPPPRYGVVGVAPGPGFVWTNGYWDWRGGRWGWVEGRWLRPPHRRAVWVEPEWRHDGNRWRFRRGYWR